MRFSMQAACKREEENVQGAPGPFMERIAAVDGVAVGMRRFSEAYLQLSMSLRVIRSLTS